VIIIPITGFATKLLSTRIFYFVAAFGFTLMSVMCAMAWNIESMIIFRALQGLFGGAMIPTAFGAVLIIFPKQLHSKVMVIIGLVVTVAPTVGPTLGGYITELLSWHFMFLLNVLPGIFVCYAVYFYVDFDKPNPRLLKNFDYLGVALMATSLGCMQYVLEEGNKKDWFDDEFILFLSIFVVITFILWIWHELRCNNPIVDLSSFKNKNFTLGCIYSFILGVGLYGTVYLLPLFLYTVAGYNTFQIGVAMIVTGLFQLISAPMAGKMFESGMDKRIILGIGFSLFGFGCYLNSFLTNESQYWEFFIPQAVRGLSLMFCFMPINDLALGTIRKEEIHNASGLYNLTRNLGGAIGLAVINSIIIAKTKIFAQGMKENISLTSPYVINAIENFRAMLYGQVADENTAAFALLSGIIDQEAFIIAINNVFVIITVMFYLGLLLLPFTTNIKHTIENAH
jgi:MFS transporter, DHA2 family, multidrug resistance protein